MDNSHLSALPGLLLPWYEAHKRDLPWRKDREPYHVWLSEIMLQQTRVEAVKGYYTRFLDALPAIEALASCDDDLLHKLWEGLGYYSRVRNLKKAAIQVMEQHNGCFPEDYEKILALPGIGAYTAGAIASISFGQKTPAIDGNVLRVLSRLQNDPSPIDLPQTKKKVQTALEAIYPEEAGAFTQALMELGATLCGPNWKPRCEECPCRSICLGYQQGTPESLPIKSPKKEKRQEDKTVLILSCDGKYALEKRPNKGLLAGLWQFPNVSGHLGMEETLSTVAALGLSVREIYREAHRKHIFTHIVWNMKGIYLEVNAPSGPFHWFTKEEITDQAAMPTAFRLFWEENDHV